MNYSEILSRRYPALLWVIEAPGDYSSLRVFGVDGVADPLLIPPQPELDALWPEVEAEIVAERLQRRKIAIFNQRYPEHVRFMALEKACRLVPDRTEIRDIMIYWNSL